MAVAIEGFRERLGLVFQSPGAYLAWRPPRVSARAHRARALPVRLAVLGSTPGFLSAVLAQLTRDGPAGNMSDRKAVVKNADMSGV